MRHTARLLATVSVIALAAVGAADLRPANAQTGPLRAGDVATDPSVRIRAETALLYANTLDRLTQIIERDIAADPGVGVITGLRSGQLSALPSLDPELRDLISSLRIGARVIDADPDPERTDERAIVFVAEGDLRSGVTRSEIESAARDARLRAVARLQGRQIQGQDGAFEIPTGMSGLPDAAVATYVGVRGRDLVTSSGAGSEGFRTLTCPDGQFGTGVIERQDLGRVTTLGGSVAETGGGWTEVSRSCVPEYAQTIRIMDSCDAADGSTGTAVFEVTQYVRRDPSDPFGTQIFTDPGSKVRVDDGGCVVGFRDDEALNLLVEGAVAGRRELELKTSTAPADVGSGVNRVPRVVAGEPGAGGPVPGIPFLATSVSDFEFIRTCAQELGPIPLPTGSVNPSGTGTGAWSGPSTFTGDVSWHRDYNRRETAFSDDPFAYILNYDLVLDPNPYGWPAKGRQRVPTTHGPAPDGDGWYRTGLLCERTLARPETQVAVRDCETGYPVFPLGTYEETRNGSGTYEEGYGAAPALLSISWAGWFETANACYNQTVTRTEETRTVRTSTGSQTCDQPQRRVRVDTTNTFQRGGSDITTSYDPDWTDDGAATNCVTQSSGGGGGDSERDFIDVDSDGWGDFSTVSEAQAAGFTGNYGISGNFDTVSNFNRSDDVQAQIDYSNSQRTESGSGGTGDSCFAPGTCVLMEDGTQRPIEQVRIGDRVAEGGLVLATGRFLASDMYLLGGVLVSGSHLTLHEGLWAPVSEHPEAVRMLPRLMKVHNIMTSENLIIVAGMTFTDHSEVGGVLIERLIGSMVADPSEIPTPSRAARNAA
jgi:hypothetical protein